MKNIYFLVIALCVFNGLSAQIVNIPDANFKAKLLAVNAAKDINLNFIVIDKNGDNEIQITEALNVYELYLYNSNISDLSGITSFTNLQTLQCSSNLLTNLNLTGLNNLKSLHCSNNQLSTLNISSITNLQFISCYSNLLPSLDVSGLTNLKNLYCSSNQLTTLDLRGITSLQSLSCGNNLILSIDISGLINLTNLECQSNKLNKINFDKSNILAYLDCSENQLTIADLQGLTKLTTLVCRSSQLNSLDMSGFINLNNLDCSLNRLTSIDLRGINKLEYLNCSSNLLTSIDLTGVTELKNLKCNNNYLTSLDLSANLTGISSGLDCSHNLLTSIIFPSFIIDEGVNLSYNLLNTIVLPLSTFYYFNCSNNKNLISIFMKNSTPEYFDESFNYQTDENFKISNCPNLIYICIKDKSITRAQNLINNLGYTNCQVNSYCSFVPGGTFYTTQGNQKLDSNSNGCDALDNIIPNLKFSITDGVTIGSLISNSTGNYSIPVQAGSYTITPILENSNYFTISPATVSVTFPTQTSPFTQNFCITPNGSHPDLEVTLLPLQPARPGFDAKYKMVYKNKGNTSQSGSVNLTFNDAALDLVVANPVATAQIVNNLSWSFINLLPFETREITFTLNVNSPMENPAVNNGYVLAYKATITGAVTDETPNDNAFTFNQTVVNSFDPNDKTCLEGTTISPSLIGEYVHYLIRFENTGTYLAQNIVVKDIIDLSKFDISTLVPTKASHSNITKISDGNKVEFIFENVNLPIDDANNDGYIAFKIKTKPTLVVNDTFINEASIFFDYNFPIITNKATSIFKTLAIQNFEFSNYFTLFPNPVNETLNIVTTKEIEVQSIAVYNILGQLVIALPNVKVISKIDVSNLKTGKYFIKIDSDKGSSSMKFIKN